MDIEVLLSPIAKLYLIPGTAHFIGSEDDSSSTPTHLLRRSFNRFFFTCSLGLLAPPSSHDRTFPTVMVCSSSGALTRILKGVADPKVISAKAPRAGMRPWLRSPLH